MAPELRALEAPRPARAAPAFVPARVLGLSPLSPRAFAVHVARPPGFEFEATRVATVRVGEERRTLTIASAPAKPWLEFATLRGPSAFKQALAALRPGDEVGLRGPHGRFHLDATRPAVMLAGHIGITPFRALLEDAAARHPALRAALLHAHPPGDAPFAEDLAALAARLPGLRVAHAPPGALADPRRVAALALPGAAYYVAGAPSEVAAAASALAALEVPRERVKVELFAGYP